MRAYNEFKDQVYSFIPNYDSIINGPHRVCVPTPQPSFLENPQQNYLKIIETNLVQLNLYKEASEYLKKDCQRLAKRNLGLKEKVKEEVERRKRMEREVRQRECKCFTKVAEGVRVDREVQVGVEIEVKVKEE